MKANIQSLPVQLYVKVLSSECIKAGWRSSVFSLRGEESVDSCKIVELAFTHRVLLLGRKSEEKFHYIDRYLDIIKYIDAWLICLLAVLSCY